MSPKDVVVIGAASSAGAHHAGQERAPDALRSAGLLDRLEAADLRVVDRGNVADVIFTPDKLSSTARHLEQVVQVATAVADAVEQAVGEGRLPLVIGGDCTITLGVVAGVLRRHPRAGVAYFDGDADLATPQTTGGGVMDAMGVAHLLGLADNALARLAPVWPMLDDERLVLFGYNRADTEAYRETVLAARTDLVQVPDDEVRQDPGGSARVALSSLQGVTDHIVVHFDVDAVDSRDVPLGNFPHYGTGVTLAAAGEALEVFLRAPQLSAVVLTEVNPSYDPSGRSLARYVGTVGRALAAALGSRPS